MKPIHLRVDIEKELAAFCLHVQLEVGEEILVLFGPSGAGKTMTLNAIAGLMIPDRGEITLDGTSFFRKGRTGSTIQVPARKRRVGYVFQQYALFPHLTALDNVAYALWRQRDAQQRAMALLERMHLAHLGRRYPHEMSGGQQQRVAIARALAAEPRVLLLDEPFAALDLGVRERLQQDLQTLHGELGLVVVYVTHSLADAFVMGHRLAVIHEGEVEQIGSPEQILRQPASANVLEVLGIRNVFRARVVESTPQGLLLDWAGLVLETPHQEVRVGDMVTAYIRPEDVKVLYPDRPVVDAVRHNQMEGRIVGSQPNSGFQTLWVALSNGGEVEIHFPSYTYRPLALTVGEKIRISLRKEGIVLLQPS